MDHGKPQSGSFSNTFGCEEGFLRSCERRVVHPLSRTEEKGSDVNLAVHLLNDGWHRRYDVALLLSQDSDLIEPLRLVTADLGLQVGLGWLDGKAPSWHFQQASIFVRQVTKSDLGASQFPNPILRPDGTEIRKPVGW
jgi:NYN domain